MMGHPNDVGKALLNAALRIRVNVAFIRRQHSRLGNETDLPAEVEEALRVLVTWAARVVVENSGTAVPVSSPPPPPSPPEPGPLAARPRGRHPMRRSSR